ncbi:MAG TPA: hypothetical protein ENI27_06780 [bacterium]|nr:hypothetical protein [bacterium]
MKLRDRLILPGVVSNESLADCSLEAQIIFRDLPMIADREGRLEDRPRRIRALLRPYDNWDIDKILIELESAGFISRYSVNGTNCVSILTFTKHQSIHWKEKESELPEPQQLPQDKSKLNPSLSQDKVKLDPSLQVEVEVQEEVKVQVEEEVRGIPFAEIIDHLNMITGKHYRIVDKTKSLIRARWNEEFRVKDFFHVHIIKAKQWLDDPEWEGYLRPITLYSNKFEGYRNERDIPTRNLSDRSRRNLRTAQEFLKKYGVTDGSVTIGAFYGGDAEITGSLPDGTRQPKP